MRSANAKTESVFLAPLYLRYILSVLNTWFPIETPPTFKTISPPLYAGSVGILQLVPYLADAYYSQYDNNRSLYAGYMLST